jgi:hypothetical protein
MVISKSVNRFCSRIYLEFIQQISPLCASKTGSLKERSARPFETRPAECAHPLARCGEEKDKIFTLKRAKTAADAAAYCESARTLLRPAPGEFSAPQNQITPKVQ